MSTSKLKLAMALVVFALVIQSVELKSASRQIDSDVNDGMVSQNLDELSSDESVSWSKVSSEEENDLPLSQATATKHHKKAKPIKAPRQEQDLEIAATPTIPQTAATAAPAVTEATSATAKPDPTTTVPASTAAAAPSAVVPSQQVSGNSTSTESTTKATTTTTSKPSHHGLFGGGHHNHMNLPTLFKRKNDTVVTIRFIPLREIILEKIARFRNLFRKPETSTSKPESGSGSKHFHFKALG